MSAQFPLEQVIYLIALLLVILILTQPLKRLGFGRLLGYAAAWMAIFGGLWFAASSLPGVGRYIDNARTEPLPALPREERMDVTGNEIRVRAERDGHFWVDADVNGRPVRFLVDTGASDVVLSARTADAVGIDVHQLRFNRSGFSASGRVNAATARVDSFRLGPIDRRNMRVSVLASDADINLLGMQFLRTLSSWRVERDTLVMVS